MSVACLVCSPLLLLVAWLAALVIRRPQPLLFTRVLIAYFARELGVILVCCMLWLISGFGARMRSPRFQALHYRLLGWFVHGLAGRIQKILDIDVAPDPSPEAARALKADRPLLFFSRHAGPGDTLLLVDLLMSRYDRRPSVVFKASLAVDPSVDLIGHRLPHAVLDASDRDECKEQIAKVTAALGPRGVLVLFPEGGNFTPERRRRALRSLWRKGRRRQAAAGEAMSNVIPPHPAGALAALDANPSADVIFAAHTGLGRAAFPREVWRHTPIGSTLKARMWLAAVAERPGRSEDEVEWLYRWWKRLDQWVETERQEAPESELAASEPTRLGA